MKSISPLRYPGGKSRLYEQIVPMVIESKSKSYAEPFSGGFGIGLLLLQNNIVDTVYINDLDINIYSFWKVLVNHPNWLIKEIKRVDSLGREQWIAERQTQLEIIRNSKIRYMKRGFATFFLNRVNRSGIIAGGIIGGIDQSGEYKIDCRFNAKRLIDMVQSLSKFKQNIIVTNLDYKDFLNNLAKDVFVFLDPPYVVKGGCLYMNNFSSKDHVDLENYLTAFVNPWVMTYDYDELIIDLYSKERYSSKMFELDHFAGKFKHGKEILISNTINVQNTQGI